MPSTKAKDKEEVKQETEEYQVVSNDRWEVLLLLSYSHVPTKVERKITENGTPFREFTFLGKEALDLWHRYKHGEKIPIADIRDVERADKIFKGFIRDNP